MNTKVKNNTKELSDNWYLLPTVSPKVYSQAQEQGNFTSHTNNTIHLCEPHTNTIVDSPSTITWANLSAPIESVLQQTGLGAQLFINNSNKIIRGNNPQMR